MPSPAAKVTVRIEVEPMGDPVRPFNVPDMPARFDPPSLPLPFVVLPRARDKRRAAGGGRAGKRKLPREADSIRLRTEPDKGDGHTHVAEMSSESGYGKTTPAPDGHAHQVWQFEVQPARGHGHELSSERC